MKTISKKVRLDQVHKLFPWVIWGIAVAFYFFQYITRVSLSGMTKPLMQDLHITATGIGFIGASYYYAYVPMQFCIGILVDKFSVRKLMIFTLLLMGFGCVIFSSSIGVLSASTARFILGFSGAFGFIGAIKVASSWFPKERFSFMVCLTQTMGMFGAIFGLIPVTFLVLHFHWRFTMMLIAITFVLLAFLAYFLMRDLADDDQALDISTTESSLLKGISSILLNSKNWLNVLYLGFLYAPVSVFGELWGTSFIHNTYNIASETAAAITSMIFLGYGVGAPIFGWFANTSNKRFFLMKTAAIINLFLFGLIVFSFTEKPVFLGTCCFLFGFFNGGSSIAYAIARDLNPKKFVGTAVAFASMMSVFIGMILQPLIGWIIDLQVIHFPKTGDMHFSAINYRLAMSTLLLCILISAILIFRLKTVLMKEQRSKEQ